MKSNVSKLLVVLFIGLYSCSKSPEFFIGKWQILSIVENNKTTDLKDNWMHLKDDGTFESYNGTINKTETGKWTYQPTKKELFIDGPGENGDTFWYLLLKKDNLIFQSTTKNSYLIAKKISDSNENY
ncbi:hypothetical protein [Psychroserpens sp.]|uniref:hypothetical protein n=1 Tax=Psychroserpens sp. TaxID=2020870 RepID=UPI002B26D3EC|nr:hypothetical protein [Psychroserpens sp.]